MDEATFDAHRHLVSAGEPTSVVALSHLTEEEYELFTLLKRNNWRAEQERLEKKWVLVTLSSL